ncbi:MAG TPA: NFACT family protein, partial [Myxococcota bacterium]|nr:NFACT family protein [Myxococcota bacterium]
MSLTALEIAAAVAGLDARLRGAVLQRVRQTSADRLVLELYGDGGAASLLVCLARDGARVHLIAPPPGAGRAPGPLVLAMRRDLAGRRLEEVHQPGGDRAVALRFGGAALMAELTGPHANFFLLDAAGIIVASLWADRSGRRDNRPGQPYTPLAPALAPRAARAPRFGRDDVVASGAIDLWYGAREEAAARAAWAARLRRAAAAALERAGRTLDKVRAEEARAAEAPLLQRMGDALVRGAATAPIGPRGATSVTLTDWTADGPVPLEVPLDPARSLRQNAARLYARARRYRQGAALAAPRRAALERRAEDLRAALAACEAGELTRAEAL